MSTATKKNPHEGSRTRYLCHDFVTASTMRREIGQSQGESDLHGDCSRPNLIAIIRRENEAATVFEDAFHQAPRQGLE